MPFESRIALTIADGIANVELNRPEKHNALDMEMFRALAATRKTIARQKGIRAVILSGAGVDFCSGLDVKSLMKDRAGMLQLLWKWLPWRANLAQAVSTGWRELPLPVIAAVHGRCWGGGLQIALGADFRIVHPDASLSVMEGKWGLIPDMGGTLALRELCGRDQAMWLAMSAEVFGANRALDLGIATALSGQPGETAQEMARQLAKRSPDAIAAVKRLYRKSWAGGGGLTLTRKTAYQARILAGRNQQTAVRRELGSEAEYDEPGRW